MMRPKFCPLLLIVVILSAVLPVPSPAAAQQIAPPIGTNLAGLVDWSTEWMFVDAFKMSRDWISQRQGANWGEGGPLNLTPDGWIASLEEGQSAETVMFTAGHHPGGDYVLLYEGEGELGFPINLPTIVSEEKGRMVVNYPADNNPLWLSILATNPDNPIRNLRFLMPGFEETYQTQPFHPLFLERLAPFKALRFMDLLNTNNSTLQEWADRPTPADPRQSVKGVAVEYLVQLANTLHADAWFNMPHLASDDFVRQFATLVRDQLDPSLKAYIEYSNETWNGQFLQAGYVIEQGGVLGLSSDDFQAGLFFHSQRAVKMFTIWEEVFGGTDRLVRVLASQAANAWTAEQVATWQNAYEHADAIAIAPYFSGNLNGDFIGSAGNEAAVTSMTVDQILDIAGEHIRGEVRDWIEANLQVAAQYGLELVAYEGGQHLLGIGGAENNEAVTHLFIEANRHPRMGELYTEYLTQWQELGGGLFMNFSSTSEFSKWGSWGVLEYQDQDVTTAPKYQALVSFIEGASN